MLKETGMTLTDTVTRTTASRTRSLLPGLLCAALSLGAWQAATAATAQDTLISASLPTRRPWTRP